MLVDSPIRKALHQTDTEVRSVDQTTVVSNIRIKDKEVRSCYREHLSQEKKTKGSQENYKAKVLPVVQRASSFSSKVRRENCHLRNTLSKIHPGVINIVEKLHVKPQQPAGATKLFSKNWEKLTQDPYILNIVKEGLMIPLLNQPKQGKIPKEISYCSEMKSQVKKEILTLMEKGAVKKVLPDQSQFLSNLFLREKKEKGTYRPVINLKNLNAYIPYEKFKMETLKDVKDILRQGDFLVKIDLKDAYFSIPLHQKSKNLVRFPWEGSIYEFQCLMFGLGPAPKIFTKLLKIPISLLRRLQIRIVIYIDDILITASSQEEAKMGRESVIYLLENLGFVINYKKSVLEPTQTLEYLGIIINSQTMTFSIPKEKLEKIETLCEDLLKSKQVTLRKLSSAIGNLMATAPAFTPAPLQVRFLQRCLRQNLEKTAQNYEAWVTLDPLAKEELTWWRENLRLLNGKPIKIQPPDLIISSDAAKGLQGGWGAHCGKVSTGGQWTPEEKGLHINILELKAASLAIKTFTKNNRNIAIHLLLDNQVALAYVLKMGRPSNETLLHLAKEIWTYLIDKQITLTAEYIPSKLNKIADFKSRNCQDWGDWKLDKTIFKKVIVLWGMPEIDLFASRTSHQIPKYYSWNPDPHCLAVDALVQKWDQNLLYAFPPFCLIGRCLEKLRRTSTTLILIAPIWVTQPWYPTLLGMLTAHPRIIRLTKESLKHPSGGPHPLVTNKTLNLAAWRISGSVESQRHYQKQLRHLSQNPGRKELENITTRPGVDSFAGVVKEKLIPFRAL